MYIENTKCFKWFVLFYYNSFQENKGVSFCRIFFYTLYAAAYLPINRNNRSVGRPRFALRDSKGKPSLPHFAIIFCYHPVFTIISFTINIILLSIFLLSKRFYYQKISCLILCDKKNRKSYLT
jgi:hypothetical protein